jgi:cellulase
MVYIAPAESNGEGDVWVKLYEDGLTDGKWGVDNFIANKGKITITLPDLAAGEYLIRPEMIGLHEASTQGAAQFYNGCGQIKVTGSGAATLPAGVDMTKAYSATDPGVLVSIYNGATTYEIPGPKVWDGASSGSGSSPAPASSAAPKSSAAAATSAVAEATPVATSAAATSAPAATSAAATSAAAAPSATAGTGSGSGSSSTLPEEFTIQEFIAWLKETTGATGSSKARRHARSFFG